MALHIREAFSTHARGRLGETVPANALYHEISRYLQQAFSTHARGRLGEAVPANILSATQSHDSFFAPSSESLKALEFIRQREARMRMEEPLAE